MKILLVSVALVGIVLAALYYGGGFASFDPVAQAEQARASITPGMSWEAVMDSIGEPKEYQPILSMEQKSGPDELVYFKPGPMNPFRRESVRARIAEGSLPHGFLIEYVFTTAHAFFVTFDGTGSVVGVGEGATMPHLLQVPEG